MFHRLFVDHVCHLGDVAGVGSERKRELGREEARAGAHRAEIRRQVHCELLVIRHAIHVIENNACRRNDLLDDFIDAQFPDRSRDQGAPRERVSQEGGALTHGRLFHELFTNLATFRDASASCGIANLVFSARAALFVRHVLGVHFFFIGFHWFYSATAGSAAGAAGSFFARGLRAGATSMGSRAMGAGAGATVASTSAGAGTGVGVGSMGTGAGVGGGVGSTGEGSGMTYAAGFERNRVGRDMYSYQRKKNAVFFL